MKLASIAAAFAQAAQETGSFTIKGRGHVDRVSIKEVYSRAAAPVLTEGGHWAMVAPGPRCGMRRMYARPIVERAAEILGCEWGQLVTSKHA